MKKAAGRSPVSSFESWGFFLSRAKPLFNGCRHYVSSVGRGGVIALMDQVVASATNFLTGIIIGRACTKDEFGLYLLCFNIVLFVVDLQTSLLSSPYTVYCQRLKGRQLAHYTGSSLIQQLMLCLLTVFAIWIGENFLIKVFPAPGLINVLDTLLLVISFIMLKEFIRRLCFANLLMKTAFLVDSAVCVIQLSGLLFLYSRALISARTAFWVVGIACAVAATGWLLIKRDLYSLSNLGFWKHLTKNWSFGSWIFGSGLLWALSMTLYPWILAYFHGTASAGIWGACWGIASIANPLMLGIQNFLGPRIVASYAKGGRHELLKCTRQNSILFLLLVLPVAVTLLFGGGYLAVLFYGAKYAGNHKIISVLAVNLLIMAVSFPFSYGLLAMEKTRAYFSANVVPLLITVSCGIYLVKKFGPFGVALGLFLGITITACIIVGYFFKSTSKAYVNE